MFTVRAENDVDSSDDMFNDALVEVNILDENDNVPMFKKQVYSFSLDENEPVETLVGNVYAHDPDLNSETTTEYSLIPASMNAYFRVNALNGDLFTRVKLDAESLLSDTFNFELQAHDSALNSTTSMSKCNVTIRLNDLNDNPPQIIILDNEKSNLIEMLSGSNSSHESKLVQMKLIDLDRDFLSSTATFSVQVKRVRRMSWPFVMDMVKSSNLNSTSRILADFLARQTSPPANGSSFGLKRVASKSNHLREMFNVEKLQENSFELSLKRQQFLLPGIYNLSLTAAISPKHR